MSGKIKFTIEEILEIVENLKLDKSYTHYNAAMQKVVDTFLNASQIKKI